MASNVKLLPLPSWTHFGQEVSDMDARDLRVAMTDYARANVEANAEKLQAEVERLEDESQSRLEACGYAVSNMCAAEARAERLADALREAQPFIGWVGSYDDLHAKIDALLHPTPTEGAVRE